MKDENCKIYFHTYKCSEKECEGCEFRLSENIGMTVLKDNESIISWHLLSEKEPSENKLYLVSYEGYTGIASGAEILYDANIVAWAELPKAYNPNEKEVKK